MHIFIALFPPFSAHCAEEKPQNVNIISASASSQHVDDDNTTDDPIQARAITFFLKMWGPSVTAG